MDTVLEGEGWKGMKGWVDGSREDERSECTDGRK